MSLSQRAGSVLLFLSAFLIGDVLGRGIGGGIGGAAADAFVNSLDLPPTLTAVFAFTVIFSVITFLQLGRAAMRFIKPILPEGKPTLPYDVGLLFRILLFCYLLVYLTSNIIYAVCLTHEDSSLALIFPTALNIISFVFGQLADVLFFATFLSLVAYRQRIQLDPGKGHFSVKSHVDGWLLITLLDLAIAQDAIYGSRLEAQRISVAYQVVVFVASADVTLSAFMARARLANIGVQDKVIQIVAFLVSPVMIMGACYRVIATAIVPFTFESKVEISELAGIANDVNLTRSPTAFFGGDGALIAGTVVGGLVSVFVVECCLLMGAPPKPPKDDVKGRKD